MAVTYDAFLARYPQFTPQGTSDQQAKTQGVIEAELAAAALEVNATYWGAHADTAVGLLAAHRIAKNPGGQFARLANKDKSSPYLEEYERMRDQILVGDRVI